MVNLKNIVFAKRTISLIAPLPCFSFIFQTLSSSISSTDFSLSLNDSSLINSFNSAISLAGKLLNTNNEGQGIVTRGSLIEIQGNSDSQDKKIVIEQHSPFNLYSVNGDYGYEEAELENSLQTKLTSSSKVEKLKFKKEENVSNSGQEKVFEKYSLNQDNFSKTNLKDKGDLKLVAKLEISLKGDKKVNISSLHDLQRLIYSSSITETLFSVDEKQSSKSLIKNYSFKFSKNNSSKDLKIELVKEKNEDFSLSLNDSSLINSFNSAISLAGN